MTDQPERRQCVKPSNVKTSRVSEGLPYPLRRDDRKAARV